MSVEEIPFRPEINDGEKDKKQAGSDDVDAGEFGDAQDEDRVKKPHAHGDERGHEAKFFQPKQAVSANVQKYGQDNIGSGKSTINPVFDRHCRGKSACRPPPNPKNIRSHGYKKHDYQDGDYA